MKYHPHTPLADLARPSASLFRLAGGVILMGAVFVTIVMLIDRVQWRLIPAPYHDEWARALTDATTPAAALVNLYYFGFLAIALATAMRLVHHRSWIGSIGPLQPAWHQFFQVAKFLLPLYALVYLLPAPEGMQASLNMPLSKWLLVLPLTVGGLIIQTSTEELIFRGYLQSQLAARFTSPKVWIVVPSLIFGMLHFDPNVDETAAWLVVIWAVCFALAAADLTARSGTLGPAIALHLVNNTLAIALIAPVGDFDGAALYTMPFSMSDTELLMTWMPVEMLILLCSWLLARLACRV